MFFRSVHARSSLARFLVGLLAVVALAGAGHAQGQKLSVPNDLQLVIMIKSTLSAYNDANVTGNYSVLRDLASPEFQQANSAARLGEAFRAERGNNIDISPILLLQPGLFRPAVVDERGLLFVQGYFLSRPKQVNFTLAYKEIASRWRLHALGVTTTEPTIMAQDNQGGRTTTGSGAAPAMSPVNQFINNTHSRTLPAPQDYAGYWGWAHPDLFTQPK